MKDEPFETYIPRTDHGSYQFNWELPPIKNRMYHAEIKERWVQVKDIYNRFICFSSVIDLYIKIHCVAKPLSSSKEHEKTY